MSANDDTILARLKTQNVRQFVSDMGAASKSVLGFGLANEEAAAKTKLTWIETQALRQSLYALRRYAFWGTTALGALAVAGVKSGITYDENRRQATDYFAATLGGARAARREVNLLTADTHLTGVGLGELARDAETMQSFGFTIKEVNTDVAVLANYAQRAHKNLGGIVEVFDRIKSTGRFTSLDLRALTSQGIPAIQIFRKELGLTAAQVDALQHGKLIIPAQYALPALTRGLAGQSNLLGTNIGQQIGRTRSFLSQIFGTGEQGLFGFVTKGLEHVNGLLSRAAQGQQTGGARGLLNAIDPSGRAVTYFDMLAGVVHSLGDALGFVWYVTRPLRIALGGILGAVAFLAGQTGLLTITLKALAFWYVVTRTRMLLMIGAEKTMAAVTWALRGAETAYIASLYAYDLAAAIFTGDTIAATAALTALNIAFLANPITWIIIGVVALGIGMYLLVTRVKAVRNAFVWAFREVKAAVADAFGFIVKVWNRLHFHIPGFSVFGHHIGGFNIGVTQLAPIPLLAGGGNVFPGGTAISGEAGPELLRNVGGVTKVTPLSGGSRGGSILDEIVKRLQVVLEGDVIMDGQKVGEVQAKARQLREAIA